MMADAVASYDDAAVTGDDSVLPFQLEALDVRGRVVRLDRSLDTILNQHRYPPAVCALIGEAVLLSAMIGQAMKLRERFSIQAQTDGPVSLVATDYFAPETETEPARIRAWARFDHEAVAARTGEPPESLLGDGHFAMTVDQGPHMNPYQGVTSMRPEGLAASAEAYFAQSDQIATRFAIAVGQSSGPEGGGAPSWRAGGVMIQHLAPMGEHALGSAEAAKKLAAGIDPDEAVEEWRRATILLDTVEQIELVGPFVTPERLLLRLFHEERPRVFPAQRVRFGCTCSRQKVEEMLRRYSRVALSEMTTDAGDISAECQFCGAEHRFELDDLAVDAETADDGQPHAAI